MADRDGLKELIHYDPLTGDLYRKTKAGLVWVKPWINQNGYVCLSIKGKQWRAHRVAWLLTYGELPKEIDHINGIRSDNRLANLRICQHRQNMGNTKMYKSNKSGYKGVFWEKQVGRWCACIHIGKKYKNLGHFDDIEEAAAAYKKAAEQHFGEFACVNR